MSQGNASYPSRPAAAESTKLLLKDALNPAVVRAMGEAMAKQCRAFDREAFFACHNGAFEALSIMQRVGVVAEHLSRAHPGSFEALVNDLCAIGPKMLNPFAGMTLSECASRRGTPLGIAALDALCKLTRFGTSEFAIRPYVERYPRDVLRVLKLWAADPDEHIRRLACEAMRPRLPWGKRLDFLAQPPDPLLPVLWKLHRDRSAYVRRSVANCLNDLTKVDPEWVLSTLERWPCEVPETRWIVQRALRTLTRAGDRRALRLTGLAADAKVVVERFEVGPAQVLRGQQVTLAVKLLSASAEDQMLVIDYAINFVGATSRRTCKVFRMRRGMLPAAGSLACQKSYRVADISTRRHSAGAHEVELFINGVSMAKRGFILVERA